MPEFITNRTQADVDRCKELAAIGWDNMTDSEKTEWYGTAMRGAYNYSDLNRVETAVAELSAFLDMGLTTKVNWGKWEYPDATHMSRYASNLQKIKTRYGASVKIPDAMNSLTHESANSIEKMLSEAYTIKGSSDVWKKHNATVEYNWVYVRNDAHESVGKTTVFNTMMGGYFGGCSADTEIKFRESLGFYNTTSVSDPEDLVGRYVAHTTQCLKVTAVTWHWSSGTVNGAEATWMSVECTCEIVGYATKEHLPSCQIYGGIIGKFPFAKGKLPSGTLIEGSLAAGYCYVRADDGSYYYYELC